MFKTKEDPDKAGKQGVFLPLLPLRDLVVFPYMEVPLFVGREKSLKALDVATQSGKTIFLATQKSAQINDPSPEDIHPVGTISEIRQMLRLPDGTMKVFIQGKQRARVLRFHLSPELIVAELEEIDQKVSHSLEAEALTRTVKSSFERYAKISKKVSSDLLNFVLSTDCPVMLSDTIAANISCSTQEKQKLLELADPVKRLEKLYALLEAEIEVLQIEKKIKGRMKTQVEKVQKEYQQERQARQDFQREADDKDEFRNEIKELERRIKSKKMPEEATARVYSELRKLKMMSPMSAEATVVRNYIDWILSLPWIEATEEKYDIEEAARILDEDHYGLEKPKERILEYLAVRALVGKIKGPILCFVGPPGVGKTSLAKSIARATGRNFVRLSLGGVRDEAEIRGHRRTYIGALPGKIIQQMKKAKSCNPVFLLDEVDKIGMDFRGDPSAALLEVLDPEQNHTFNDHYLDLDYDLSRVMFITTANTLHGIQPPLQDRMEIIRLPGYTEDEKLQIAKRFLIPKQRKANGLEEHHVEFTDNAILQIIRHYTREAGVRNLEREIASICRKVAKELVKNKEDIRFKVTARNISKYLGVPKFRHGVTEEKDYVGIANGLAWTDAGGELLSIEVAIMPGKGKLITTGKLGEVMQESGQAALSYVRSRAHIFGLDKDFYQNIDIHIHVPEGATPKDGPSAGITMATAITSALIGKSVRHDLAMTGEITLRGRVLPVGGLKEKILAAHRANVKTVIIPSENEKDLKEIPGYILKELRIVLTDHMDTVLKEAIISEDLARKIDEYARRASNGVNIHGTEERPSAEPAAH